MSPDLGKKHKIPSYLSWLFPYKKKGLSLATGSPLSYYLFQNKISLGVINWTFQGIRSMGFTDIIGKFLMEVIFFALCISIWGSAQPRAVVFSLLSAHTLNWLLNSHFWDVGRFLGITRTSPERFVPYIRAIGERVAGSASINSVIVVGGVSRNAGFRETSDVDMIFITAGGFRNSLIAECVTIRERVFAFFLKFPLHLELYDTMEPMHRFRTDEIPILIKDADDRARHWYEDAERAVSLLEDIT